MKISFGICTHNEVREFNELYHSLITFIKHQHGVEYEIIIVDDFSDDEGMLALLALIDQLPDLPNCIRVYEHALGKDFATHKNFMNAQCTGDWIFNLDADEKVSPDLLELIPLIIENNPAVDAYWLPRINTVHGLTLSHVQRWRWTISTLPGYRRGEMLSPESDQFKLLKEFDLIRQIDHEVVIYDEPIICWPDPQMRLYRNKPNIRWEGKVHEHLVGYKNYSRFPFQPEYAIRHEKDISRQEQQNNFYESLQ